MGDSAKITSFEALSNGSIPGFNNSAEDSIEMEGHKIRRFSGEFWTSKQRQASSLHEVSYRACFKAQLPKFFIEKFTREGDLVFDPFNGRGTTTVEGVLNKRLAIGMDVNPLSEILTRPRINVPKLTDIYGRLDSLDLDDKRHAGLDLSMFYHKDTELELESLRRYLQQRKEEEKEDKVDSWIRMVATNRLSGHSSGFFSVYTLPPNQAASQDEQARINGKRGQVPEYRNVKQLIKKKSASLLRDFKGRETALEALNRHGTESKVYTLDSRHASDYVAPGSVDLTVTSPPFLNIVQYSKDNWLRCWFNDIDVSSMDRKIFVTPNLGSWRTFIKEILAELYELTKHGGHVAFEVGEVRNGTINLDEYVALDGLSAGFEIEGILINKQAFTKTSNIWGVSNQSKGTNTNRIVLFRKA